MSDDRPIQLALQLMRLGVSRAGVADLLSQYPYDVIERQLGFLPYRKAKRPEALIIDAIRHNYSPPNNFYYASSQTPDAAPSSRLDEDTQLPHRSPPA